MASYNSKNSGKKQRLVIGMDARFVLIIKFLFPRLHHRILNFMFSNMDFKDKRP